MMVSVGDFDRFLFVVGAPRCGTTTLAQFLRDHPAISFPVVKEPHYFAQHDLRGLGDAELKQRVEDEYLRRFFPFHNGASTGADASVTYLYMAEQLEPALRLWPESRFIVAVRNPLSMLPSLHRRLIYLGDETIRSFADAWAAVPDRAAGRRIPHRCADPRWLRYDEAARFATHLERLYAVVGRDRCHVVIFDDLEADPETEYSRLMSFVGLEPVANTDFTARRAGKDVRYMWLQRLLKRPPAKVRDIFAGEQFHRRVRDLDESRPRNRMKAILSFRKRLLRWNRIAAVPQPLPARLQGEIREQFAGEIGRLEKLIGRDLSHWLDESVVGSQEAEVTAIAAE